MVVESITQTSTVEMTETEWGIVHTIAQTLAKETDVNELGKAIAYLRNTINQNQPDAGARFFKYLKTLVNNSRTIGHSGRTLDYYRNIEQSCSQYLFAYQTQPTTMLHLLGWVTRLMRYYKEGGAIAETITPTLGSPQPSQKAETGKPKPTQAFQIDQILEAKVTKINGNKVTYELLDGLRLTEKEPKKNSQLQEGQTVKVRVALLKEDGSIKSVKCAE